MKTVVIWNTFDYGLKYFMLDGDYRKFDGVFVGHVDNQELQDELSNFMWTEDGVDKPLPEFETFPLAEILSVASSEPVFVIEAGIIP